MSTDDGVGSFGKYKDLDQFRLPLVMKENGVEKRIIPFNAGDKVEIYVEDFGDVQVVRFRTPEPGKGMTLSLEGRSNKYVYVSYRNRFSDISESKTLKYDKRYNGFIITNRPQKKQNVYTVTIMKTEVIYGSISVKATSVLDAERQVLNHINGDKTLVDSEGHELNIDDYNSQIFEPMSTEITGYEILNIA